MKKFPINKNNVIIVILAAALVVITYLGYSNNALLKSYQQGKTPYKYTDGKEDEFFPYDQEKADKIDSSEPAKDGETWAVYMYLNASNLELNGHDQLSDFVEDYIVEDVVNAKKEADTAAKKARIQDFISTEEANSEPMPLSFYEVDYDKEAKSVLPEEDHTVSNTSWGSDILDAFINTEMPDNFTYVVQPGGSTAWKNTQVNPNRTRRFVKKGDELKEVYDAPVSNMGEAETLADFLKFCKENYPADHTMVILTDHGGAMTGFGWDYIYGDDNLTLKELTEAFDEAYGLDEDNPPVDLLYFNACLMSNTDVINSMRGVCKYMVAGEEVGWAESKYYDIWMKGLCDRPNVNAAQLGKALIDAYTKNLTEDGALLGSPNISGLCLLDMKKAGQIYDTYAQFAGQVLEKLAENPNILMRFSRAINSSINFAVEQYRSYNVTDLGLWMEGLEEYYPEETKAMISLIDDAVIYKRADSYLEDAHGISVYFPNYIETTGGLNVALNYIDNISYSEDISALYYYKIAGCLNEKYKEYCSGKGIALPENINYSAIEGLRNIALNDADSAGNISGSIPKEAAEVIMDARYELCKVSSDEKTVTYYGEDRFVNPDFSNGVETDFEGKWVDVGGQKLAVEVINVTDDAIMYECPVMYKDFEYKLVITCEEDPETGEDIYDIEGLRAPSDEAATIDRNIIELKPGSTITPVYNTSDINGGEMTKTTGMPIVYNINTRIGDGQLEKGEYRARIVFEDMRGDDVYSDPIYFEVK